MADKDQAQLKPRIFIASSGAGLLTARDIQTALIDVAEPTVWDKEDWQGKGTLEQLMNLHAVKVLER